MKVVMAAEPRVYREAIGETIKDLKPHIEVAIVDPEDLKRAVSNLDPELVICSQPDTFTPEGRPAWIEFRPYDEPTAKVCLGGRYSELEEKAGRLAPGDRRDREALPNYSSPRKLPALELGARWLATVVSAGGRGEQPRA